MTAPQISFRGQTPFGTAGMPVDKGVRTNLFRIGIPSKELDQYDGKSASVSLIVTLSPSWLTHALIVCKYPVNISATWGSIGLESVQSCLLIVK